MLLLLCLIIQCLPAAFTFFPAEHLIRPKANEKHEVKGRPQEEALADRCALNKNRAKNCRNTASGDYFKSCIFNVLNQNK
jgi:hypothetical protein